MSNNKFHKILSDTITLPLLPADNFNETNTGYYAVLERNYIPITSDIICIYKPDWITGYKFIKEGENENGTKEDLKYYFPEFTPFEGQCKFNGCDHIHEPGCAVKEAVEEGKIHKIRYEDYTEMYRELKERKRY